MEIIYKSTKEIKPYENNPRNNNEAVEKVAVSITDYGFRGAMSNGNRYQNKRSVRKTCLWF